MTSRSRSLSCSGETDRPSWPLYTDEAAVPPPTSHETRRVAMPRAVSTPDMYRRAATVNATAARDAVDEINRDDDDDEAEALRDTAREQIDADTLRELVRFFRETGPPGLREPSLDLVGADCFGTAARDRRRWSIQSLRKARRGRLRPTSLQVQTSDAVIRSTTAAGHTYFAIAAPGSDGAEGDHGASLLLPNGHPEEGLRPPELPLGARVIERGWPRRSTSSHGIVAAGSPSRLRVPSLRIGHALTEEEEDEVARETRQASALPVSAQSSALQFYSDALALMGADGAPEDSAATISKHLGLAHESIARHLRRAQENARSAIAAAAAADSTRGPSSFESARGQGASHDFDAAHVLHGADRDATAASTPRGRSMRRGEEDGSAYWEATQSVRPPKGRLAEGAPSPSLTAAGTATHQYGSAQDQVAQGAPNSAYMYTYGPLVHSERAARPRTADSVATTKPDREGASMDSAAPSDDNGQPSCASTVDSYSSAYAADSKRHSISSDTTTTSFATALTGLSGRQTPLSFSDSREPVGILERKRSRWSLMYSGMYSDMVPGGGSRRGGASERSDSVHSSSSTGTVGGSHFAERRSARKAKVREKFHKDLDATRADQGAGARTPGEPWADAVDSPVPGWNAQNAPVAAALAGEPLHARKASGRGFSHLRRVSDALSSGTGALRRRADSGQSTLVDVPENSAISAAPVDAPDTPRAATLASWTTAKSRGPGGDSWGQDERGTAQPSPRLTLTPVMVVADIEARSPASPLRPLSLLHAPPASPGHHARSHTSRSDRRASLLNRPFPIKVATLSAKSPRRSLGGMPTPPLSPEPSMPSTAASRRRSLPLRSMDPKPAARPTRSHVRSHSFDPHGQLLSEEAQTEWLRAHQRETVEEWRLAALKDRARLMKDKEALDRERRLTEMPSIEEQDDGEADQGLETPGVSSDGRISTDSVRSANATERNRLDALNLLSSRAVDGGTDGGAGIDLATSPEGTPSSAMDGASWMGIGSSMLDGGLSSGGHSGVPPGGVLEQRLRRLEQSGDVWLTVVVPMLENMSRMLRDMHEDNVGRELTARLMDTALAAASASMESQRSGRATPGSEAQPGGIEEAAGE